MEVMTGLSEAIRWCRRLSGIDMVTRGYRDLYSEPFWSATVTWVQLRCLALRPFSLLRQSIFVYNRESEFLLRNSAGKLFMMISVISHHLCKNRIPHSDFQTLVVDKGRSIWTKCDEELSCCKCNLRRGKRPGMRP